MNKNNNLKDFKLSNISLNIIPKLFNRFSSFFLSNSSIIKFSKEHKLFSIELKVKEPNIFNSILLFSIISFKFFNSSSISLPLISLYIILISSILFIIKYAFLI